MGEGLLRAYAAILFSSRPVVGLLFLGSSFWFPNAGMAGLIGALTGSITARLLSFPYLSRGLYIYNSLLVGLALGIVYRLDGYLLTLILLGAVLAVFLTVALADMLWRLEHLPVLSLPFVVVAFTCFFAAQAYGNLSVYLFPSAPVEPFVGGWTDAFLTALGSAFFIPHPVAGLFFFIGLLWTSRYLALLAVVGYLVGDGLLQWLSGSIHPTLGQWGGFNFILTTIAVGGIFSVPGWRSLLLAIIAAALSSLITMAVQGVLQVYGVPVLAIPFLLTTLTMLAAMRKRVATTPPYLLLEAPALPEHSYERARLVRARGAEPESVPLRAPFFGSWRVYQGFDGPHTHQPPWQHALDFIITEQGRSFRNAGHRLQDFHCFDLPVLSPCHGTVARCLDELPDNPPGEVDSNNNWGNFLLIRLDSGLYVLLAHLRQHSLTVIEGERLTPGQPVARCGNTGRSPQPHLHLHVQTTAVLGSPTHPFHLLGVTLQTTQEQIAGFHLACRPAEGELVSVVKMDGAFWRALHLPLGLQLHYRYRLDEGEWRAQRLTVSMDLTGGFRLRSGSGASARFLEEGGVLCFFERAGGKDPLLDLWLLALGLTPLADAPMSWADRPSDRLLPLAWPWWALRGLLRPLGGGLDSRYHRSREKGLWRQQGQHRLPLLPGIKQEGASVAIIDPERGCTRLSLQTADCLLEAELEEISTIEDQGIPQARISLKETY
jgi:urea transporter